MPSANIGFAPTAYTSLTLFAAAIAPKAAGSSTMGVKKSTVATSARSGAMRYTAASSRDAAAVSTLGSTIRGRAPITCPSSTGLSLQAQPAPWLYSVNRRGDTSFTVLTLALRAWRVLASYVEAEIPSVGISFGGNDLSSAVAPMDWGVLIPLWFMGGRSDPPVPVVVVTPARDLPATAHVEAGRAIARAAEASGRPVAFIASADHGHAHSADGPYGFDEKAR